MTIKDIVELASVYLQLEDVLSTSDFSSSLNASVNPQVTADEITTRNINLLIRCTSLVLSEIATDFIKLKKQETLPVVNSQISYNAFSENVLDVLKVKTLGEMPLKFKKHPEAVMVNHDGNVLVEYRYLPASYKALSDEIVGFDLVPARIIAYGVASEYSFISGMNSEASIWDERFKNAMLSLSKKSGNIPPRRW